MGRAWLSPACLVLLALAASANAYTAGKFSLPARLPHRAMYGQAADMATKESAFDRAIFVLSGHYVDSPQALENPVLLVADSPAYTAEGAGSFPRIVALDKFEVSRDGPNSISGLQTCGQSNIMCTAASVTQAEEALAMQAANSLVGQWNDMTSVSYSSMNFKHDSQTPLFSEFRLVKVSGKVEYMGNSFDVSVIVLKVNNNQFEIIDMTSGFTRLPTKVIPSHYDLSIMPEMGSQPQWFMSNVVMHVRTTENVKAIVVNINEMEPSENPTYSWVKDANGNTTFALQQVLILPGQQVAVFLLENTLPTGDYTLRMQASAILNDDMRGFYRSRVSTSDDNTEYLAITQFESTDARMAFACFDEPNMKATFNIQIISDDKYEALANTKAMSVDRTCYGGSNCFLTHKFERTPKMSTYLVAFSVGQFGHIEKQVTVKDSQGESPVLVRVYSTPAQAHKLQYALDAATDIIVYFSELFDMRFPISKCDFMAIPDFAAGAMENWGLITYRETALLIDPDTASSANRERVATVIAHELVHQWFGNTVTADWWSSLFLNEGFATFFEYWGAAHFRPSWRYMKYFNYMDRSDALDFDSTIGTHALFNPEVDSPGEIGQMFDSISYAKGGTVIRMAQSWMDKGITNPADRDTKDTPFLKGLQFYLRQNQYGNADARTLWTNVASQLPANARSEFIDGMLTWTNQKSYPFIKASKDGVLTTAPYNPEIFKNSQVTPSWWIPLSVQTSSSSTTQWESYQSSDSKSIANIVGDSQWFLINKDGRGAYRVQYEDDALQNLISAIGEGKLSSQDLLAVIDDISAMAFAKDPRSTLGQTFSAMRAAIKDLRSVMRGRASVTPSTLVRLIRDIAAHDAAPISLSDVSARLSDGPDSKDVEVYMVWRVIFATLNQLFSRLEGWPEQQKVATLARSISAELGKGATWNFEEFNQLSHPTKRLVALIHSQGLFFRYSGALEQGAKAFQDNFNPNTKMLENVPGDLRDVVFGAAVASDKYFDSVSDMMVQATDAAEKIRLIRALGMYAATPARQMTVLGYSTDRSKVRKQDASYVLTYISRNPRGGLDSAWKYTQEHWNEFMSKALFGSSRLVRLASAFATQQKYDEVKAFYDAHPMDGYSGLYQSVLSSIQEKSAWATKSAPKVSDAVAFVQQDFNVVEAAADPPSGPVDVPTESGKKNAADSSSGALLGAGLAFAAGAVIAVAALLRSLSKSNMVTMRDAAGGADDERLY